MEAAALPAPQDERFVPWEVLADEAPIYSGEALGSLGQATPSERFRRFFD
jgi:hypothetical protein